MNNALIIDDETDICFLLGKILQSKNIQTNFATTITEANHLLEKEQPQIIFLDNHLPDGLGIDFIQQAKQKVPGTKIVMITAYDNFSDRAKAFKNGVDTFIPKPFTKEIIYRELEKLLPH